MTDLRRLEFPEGTKPLTVADLIAALQTMPADKPVRLVYDTETASTEIRAVALVNDMPPNYLPREFVELIGD